MNYINEAVDGVAATHARRIQTLESLLPIFQNKEVRRDKAWQDSVALVLSKYFSTIWPNGVHTQPKREGGTSLIITGKDISHYEIVVNEEEVKFTKTKDKRIVFFTADYASIVSHIRKRIRAEEIIVQATKLATEYAVFDEDGNITGIDLGFVRGEAEEAKPGQIKRVNSDETAEERVSPDEAEPAEIPRIKPLNFEKLLHEKPATIKSLLEFRFQRIGFRSVPNRDAVVDFKVASVDGLPEITETDIYYKQPALRFRLVMIGANFEVLVGKQGPIEVKCAEASDDDEKARITAEGVWEGLADLFSPPVVRMDGTLDFHAFIDAKRYHRAQRIDTSSNFTVIVPGHYNIVQDQQNSTQWLREALVKFDMQASRGVGSLTKYRPSFEYREEFKETNTLQRVLVHADKYEFIAELNTNIWCGSVKHFGFSPSEARVTVNETGVKSIDWVGMQTFDNGYPSGMVYTEAEHVLGEYIREVFRLVFGFAKN